MNLNFLKDPRINWKYILIVVILVVIAGGGYWFYWNWQMAKQEKKLLEFPEIKRPEKVEKVEDETPNWKNYRNEEYGFEIKYPAEFTISSEGPNSAQEALDRGEQISGTVAPSYDTIIFSDDDNELARIEIFHKYEKDILEENYKDKDYLYLFGPCDVRWDFKPEIINLEFINDLKILTVKGKAEGNISQNCYYLKNIDGNLIVISNKGYKTETFNQMLSTFKFIEPKVTESIEDFCGSSTYGSCTSDSDCITGGCSGQVCQSKNEEKVITTCEMRDCYDARKYNLNCKCLDNKCQWSK